MNPTIQRNPQNFVMAMLHASQVKKYLESHQVDVDSGFVVKQALIGGMLDNPWMFALLMQNEISRLDKTTPAVNPPVAGSNLSQAELEAQIRKSFSDALAVLNFKPEMEVQLRAAMAEVLEKIGGENFIKTMEQLTKDLMDSRQQVTNLEAEVGRLKDELARRTNANESLATEASVLSDLEYQPLFITNAPPVDTPAEPPAQKKKRK